MTTETPPGLRSPGALRWAALIAAAAAAVFLGTLRHPFLGDDHTIIRNNPVVQQPGRALEAFTTDYWAHIGIQPEARDRLYRPLTVFSFALNRAAGGSAPIGFRVVNLALHALASAALLWLGLRLGLSARAAGAAGLLFALHPVHTEAVNDVVGRADLAAAALVFAGLGLMVGSALPAVGGADAPPPAPGKGRRKSAPGEAVPEGGAGRWTAPGAGLALLAALLFKEIGGALLLAALLWWAWCRLARGGPEAERRRVLLHTLGAMGIASLAYAGMRYATLDAFFRPVPPSPLDNILYYAGPGERVLGALGVLGRYFKLLVWPWPLSPDYSYAEVVPWGRGAFLWAALGAGGLGAWAAAAWGGRRRRPEVAFGLALFLSAWLPVSNLPFPVPVGTVMAERLLYLPSAGFLLGAVPWAEDALRRLGGRAPAAALAAVAVAFAGMTWARNRQWADPLRFWASAYAAAPASARVLHGYGGALLSAGRAEEALPLLRRSVDVYRRDDPAWLTLGAAQLAAGRLDEAAHSLGRALRLNPGYPEALVYLGMVEARRGRLEEARRNLERGVAGAPSSFQGRFLLGNVYMKLRRPALAAAQYEAALRYAPGRGDIHHNLAIALMMSGRREEGLAHAREAERLGVRLLPELAEEVRRAGGR